MRCLLPFDVELPEGQEKFGLMVPKPGVEPGRPCEHQLLRLACLPFHHFGIEAAENAFDRRLSRPLPSTYQRRTPRGLGSLWPCSKPF
jgi:hypothetical protein